MNESTTEQQFMARFDRAAVPPPWLVWSVRGLAVAGLAVAAYLSWVALTGQAAAGCGPGDAGCGHVLGSRWSKWLGVVPVSMPAVVVYLSVLAASFALGNKASGIVRRRAWLLLIASAVLLTGAAVWFLLLQLIVLRQLCPYCVAEHAIGLVMSSLILAGADAGRHALRAMGAGVLAVVILVAGQVAVPGKTMQKHTLGGQTAAIEIVGDFPVLGPRDAPHTIVSMFDYKCPHCRVMHQFLTQARQRYGQRLGIIVMPLPRNASCNDTVAETDARFEDSCDLAKIALAVHLVKPEAFDAFDAWLFEPVQGRTGEQALTKAGELIGKDVLTRTIESGEPAAIIQKAVDVHKQTLALSAEFDRVPKLLAQDTRPAKPQLRIFVSRPASAQELFDALEGEIGIKPKPD